MLFSPEDLDDALRLLVTELVAAGVGARFQIVGAAAVTMQVGREALTRDIDAFYTSTPELENVLKRIAARRTGRTPGSAMRFRCSGVAVRHRFRLGAPY